MTKIKNTKKGMAKKTLSISLAVAMLATSNVPVWAAEFTDGTDAAFTSEAVVETPVDEAPVVEEEVADNASYVTETDLNVSGVTVKVGDTDVKGKTVTYGQTITVGGKIIKTNEADPSKAELQQFNYAYRLQGDSHAFTDSGRVTNGIINFTTQITGDVWKAAAAQNKPVELYIFEDSQYASIKPTVVATFKVVPEEVSGNVILKNLSGLDMSQDTYGDYTVEYTGKKVAYKSEAATNDYALEIEKLDVADSSEDIVDLSDYDVTVVGGPVLNAKEEMTIRVTPKEGSGKSGVFTTTVKVVKADDKKHVSDYVKAELNEALEYEYTGNDIAVPADKVTVKENGYANATLPQSVIKEAAVVEKGVGEKTVRVYLDNANINNFAIADKQYITTTDTVDVKKRNLAADHTKISIKHGKLPENWGTDWVYSRLLFNGIEAGNPELNLVNGKDYTVVVYNDKGDRVTGNMTGGTYTAVVSAPKTSANTTGSQTITFQVGEDVFAGVRYMNTYTPEYTGAELKPTKDDLGELEITESVAGGNDQKFIVSTKDYDVVSYNKNVDASTYDENGNILTYGEVVVKVHDNAPNYPGKTFTLKFEIKPLTVHASTITVPEVVSYNKDYTDAAQYKVPLIVTAVNEKGKGAKGLSEKDFTVEYEFVKVKDQKNANAIGNKIRAKVTVTNPNFKGLKGKENVVTFEEMSNANKTTTIVAKALTDSMVKVNPSSYTYTGDSVVPSYYVMDGANVLYDVAEYGQELGEYKFVRCENDLNVGTAKVVVEGDGEDYSGTASATFEITPADTKDVKVTIKDQIYTGKTIRPRTSDITVTLNGNDVTKQFEVVTDAYGENISGKGTVTLRPVSTTKNFTGANVVAEFNIVKELITADLHVFDKNGIDVTNNYKFDEKKKPNASFEFDGTAKTFKDVLLKEIKRVTEGPNGSTATKATAEDFEIKYADNIAGKKTNFVDGEDHYNVGYVYAVGKDGSGYAGDKFFYLADGTKVTGVVAMMPFAIKNVRFVDANVTVSNGVYAGGLPVKPQVIVQIGGNTLVEGKDYELKLDGDTDNNRFVETTLNKPFTVEVIGKGGYEGSKTTKTFYWGIDKKDLKDCDIKVVNGVAYVMNGYIPVPVTEYTVKDNGDKTYTVTANAASKNYTGSKTVVAEGQKPTDKPETPMIQSVKVVGNKATVILSGETEGAVGYDYVISTDKDCINNKDYDKVNKNILNTTTDFTYVGQDVYYAYCHAWKRGEDGKKIFSDWSNAYPFVVSAITPSQPAITSVKVKGSTVTVTYTKSSNADGYDVVLGSKVATVAGEKRPVEYGTLVKKNIKGNTVTATFKNVKKGTYYAGLHAFNRTSEDGKKVFSPWSNVKRVTVK